METWANLIILSVTKLQWVVKYKSFDDRVCNAQSR